MVLMTIFAIPRLSGTTPGLLVRGSAVTHPWTAAGIAAAVSILRDAARFAGFGSPVEAQDQIRLGPGGVVCWLPATAVTPGLPATAVTP